jgi:carbamate kinase
VDKDFASAILARDVDAGVLLMCTDVEGVYEHYGAPEQRLIDRLGADQAAEMLEAGTFPAGSMGPKVEAALEFVRAGGEKAIIAALDDAEDALQGRAGTVVSG